MGHLVALPQVATWKVVGWGVDSWYSGLIIRSWTIAGRHCVRPAECVQMSHDKLSLAKWCL